MREAAKISLPLHRQQSRALRCPAQEILYGGAAGGGKSHLIRAAFLTWALAVPGLQLYLFRRTFPELKLNHLQGPGSFHELLAPLVNQGMARITEHEIRLHNGSAIQLRHLQYAKDLAIYQGAEIHVLGMDEATHFTDGEYRYLRGRCRIGGLKVPTNCQWTFPRILLGTNPGSRGHHWAKQGFVDHGPYVIHRADEEEGGMLRCFIPALAADNPSLIENDPTYLSRLHGLGDPLLVRTLLDGDWSVVAGAMYGDVWRANRHICDPFPIPVDWPIWIGADDGYNAPACTEWLTANPATGTHYAIGEIYKAGMLPAEFAERMKDVQGQIEVQISPDEPPEPCTEPVTGLMDSAAFADTGQGQITRGKQLRKLGIRIRPVEKWPGSRKDRAQNLHRMLAPNAKEPDRRPGLIVFRGRCPNLVRTLPTLGRDPNDAEAVNTDEEDHAYDALTYGLQARRGTVTKTKMTGM